MGLGRFLEQGHVVDIRSRKQDRERMRQRRNEWHAAVEEAIEPVYDAIADAVTRVHEINADYLDVSRGEHPSEVVYQRLKHLLDNFSY